MTREINASTWNEEMTNAGDTPVVVDIWQEQCEWCQRLNPVYQELSNEYDKAILTKLNIRTSSDNLQMAQKLGVQGTPTMKVFCRGREVGEVVGFMEKEALRQQLDVIVENSKKCLEQSEEIAA